MKSTLAMKTCTSSLLYLLIVVHLFNAALSKSIVPCSTANRTTHGNNESHSVHKIKVASFNFKYIATPFLVVLWVLLASFMKLGFHLTTRLSKLVPESCMIILLGVLLGGFLRLIKYQDFAGQLPFFNSRIFFLFLLPPIVLDAGYFLHTRAFFDNIGTILLYAVVGTIFNTFTVGVTLYYCTDLGITLLQMLLFSCLIAAVDPVAVLAVFEEVHVNEVLYILVFGESLLNDAVTVVLYRLFEAFVSQKTVKAEEVFIGIVAFFVVSFGGMFIGIIWAYITAFSTKYTDHVRVLEPIFVFGMSYMAYLSAELFHFSGIISIVTCAFVMKPYVEANISQKSRLPLKYFMKMASSLSETIIFMLLGVILFNRPLEFHAGFIALTILFTAIYRCLGVVLLTWLANKIRLNKLGKVDQFVMAYGGLRGAVAFSLATLINKHDVPKQTMMETTAIAVVLFTVFIQGTTIKPIVEYLKVKRSVKRKDIMLGEVNDKMMDHLLGGIQEVIQHRGHYYWKNLYQYAEAKYLRRWFMRHRSSIQAGDGTLLTVYKKISYRDAMLAADKRAPSSSSGSDEDKHGAVKDRRRTSALAPCAQGDNERFKDAYNHVRLALLLGKQTQGHRRFSRNNVVDGTDICEEALYTRRHSQHQRPTSLVSRKTSRESGSGDELEEKDRSRRRGRKKHGHKHGKHRKAGHHRKVNKMLSDIPESPPSTSPPSTSPPRLENPRDTPEEVEPAVKEPADDESSTSDSESEHLLPKLADLGPSSPTLDTHYSDMDVPLVAMDTRALSPADGTEETFM